MSHHGSRSSSARHSIHAWSSVRCVCWSFSSPVSLFLSFPLLFFQTFQTPFSAVHKKFMSKSPRDFRLGTVASNDHETPLTGRGGPLLRAIQARVVERKVSDLDAADVIQRAVEGLRSFGHRGRVAIKANNEPAILALKEEIMRRPEVGAIPAP